MRSPRRVIAALLLALLCAPGTWLRSETGPYPQGEITLERVAGARATGVPGWRVEGVWAFAGEGLLFGGSSALLALPGDRFLAFSDRGARFSFADPATGSDQAQVARQPVASGAPIRLPDFEAATRDPATGTYWLSVEMKHALLRYTRDHRPDGARRIDGKALGWTPNSGAEGLVRMADGRFVLLPETKRELLVFPDDPIEGAKPATVPVRLPLAGHSVTDLAQLPDGRLLVLLRAVDLWGGWPPFASAIAIGPPPKAGQREPWSPRLAIDLAEALPRENWEGMALRASNDGRIAVWLIADDNQSVLQRTLVAKLLLDPAAL